MTPPWLNEKYDRLKRRKEELDAEFESLRLLALASGQCDHTRSYEYEVSNDDGYGKWWKVPYMNCLLCGLKFYRYGQTDAWRQCSD